MAEPPPPPPPILGDGVEIIDAQVQVASTDYRDMANNQQNNNTNANTDGHQQQEQPMIGPQPPPEGMQQQENMPDQHILQLWNDVAQNLREHQTGKFFDIFDYCWGIGLLLILFGYVLQYPVHTIFI